MIKNIFFDLDGTLIDAKKRLYSLFQALVPESKFTIEEYWHLKRSKINHKKILTERLGYSETAFADFEKYWLDLIETKEYLRKDIVYTGVLETLKILQQKFVLNVVTARQSIENTYWQLKKLGLYNFFSDILITGHKTTKPDLLSGKAKSEDFIVGDTGQDIIDGKSLHMNTISVSHGFVAREMLIEYEPDFLIDNLDELYEILQ
jgi:phosphoglycolate phosphatase